MYESYSWGQQIDFRMTLLSLLWHINVKCCTSNQGRYIEIPFTVLNYINELVFSFSKTSIDYTNVSFILDVWANQLTTFTTETSRQARIQTTATFALANLEKFCLWKIGKTLWKIGDILEKITGKPGNFEKVHFFSCIRAC